MSWLRVGSWFGAWLGKISNAATPETGSPETKARAFKNISLAIFGNATAHAQVDLNFNKLQFLKFENKAKAFSHSSMCLLSDSVTNAREST